MSLKTLILNRQSYQFLLLAFLLLQVVGKVESRRPYENRFEDLSEEGKNAAEQLDSFHQQLKDIKEMAQITAQNKTVVQKANSDNVTISGGLATVGWLLYQSIDLGKIERFFDEIEELKGQFKEYSRLKMPKLQELYRSAGEYTDYTESKKQLAYLNEVHEELKKYYGEMQELIDKSDEVIEDVNKAKQDADKRAAVFGLIAVLAGGALLVGGPVAMPPVIWKSVAVAAMALSMAYTMSIRNAHDLTKASERLTTLKHELKQLREQVMEKMMEMTTEIIRLIKKRSLIPPIDPLIHPFYENLEISDFVLVWVGLAICAILLSGLIYFCLKRGKSHRANSGSIVVVYREVPCFWPFYRNRDFRFSLDWFEFREIRKQLDSF